MRSEIKWYFLRLATMDALNCSNCNLKSKCRPTKVTRHETYTECAYTIQKPLNYFKVRCSQKEIVILIFYFTRYFLSVIGAGFYLSKFCASTRPQQYCCMHFKRIYYYSIKILKSFHCWNFTSNP